MKIKFLRTVCCAAMAACALTIAASADCIGGAETKTAVNLREGAGTGYGVIRTLDAGTRVIVEENDGGGWLKVSFDGREGFMSAGYMSFAETMELEAAGWVDGTDVRQRSGPGTDSEIQRVTTDGEELKIVGVAGNWYKVVAGEQTGYIRSDYVSLVKKDAQAASSGSVGERVVELAKQYLGYKYVWAGASPSTGFDCSGFVSYVFKTLGYQTNRTAADIYKNGYYVEKSALQPGDAVFFGSNSQYIGHTGIYIGEGKFIHASSGCGYVTISGLDENYYARRYVGARRIAE